MMHINHKAPSCLIGIAILLNMLWQSPLAYAQSPASNSSSSTSETSYTSDIPTNDAFYKVNLSYPNSTTMRAIPKLERRACIWVALSLGIFALLTWPLDPLELLVIEREERRKQRALPKFKAQPLSQRSPESKMDSSAKAERYATISTAKSWDAEAIPMLRHPRLLNASKDTSSTINPFIGAFAALASETNPLQALIWRQVGQRFRLPLSETYIEAGLHLFISQRPLQDTLHDMIIDTLRHTQGQIIIVSSELNEANLVRDLVGAQEADHTEQIYLIRKNSHQLQNILKRLYFTNGSRLFLESFLRQIKQQSQKGHGIATVIFDISARYEVGARPHLQPLEDWCRAIHEIATHGVFPIILTAKEKQLPSGLPYPSYREEE